ncbi:hypothetical protein V8D89_004232 [Ganoderma adspersum]
MSEDEELVQQFLMRPREGWDKRKYSVEFKGSMIVVEDIVGRYLRWSRRLQVLMRRVSARVHYECHGYRAVKPYQSRMFLLRQHEKELFGKLCDEFYTSWRLSCPHFSECERIWKAHIVPDISKVDCTCTAKGHLDALSSQLLRILLDGAAMEDSHMVLTSAPSHLPSSSSPFITPAPPSQKQSAPMLLPPSPEFQEAPAPARFFKFLFKHTNKTYLFQRFKVIRIDGQGGRDLAGRGEDDREGQGLPSKW